MAKTSSIASAPNPDSLQRPRLYKKLPYKCIITKSGANVELQGWHWWNSGRVAWYSSSKLTALQCLSGSLVVLLAEFSTQRCSAGVCCCFTPTSVLLAKLETFFFFLSSPQIYFTTQCRQVDLVCRMYMLKISGTNPNLKHGFDLLVTFSSNL